MLAYNFTCLEIELLLVVDRQLKTVRQTAGGGGGQKRKGGEKREEAAHVQNPQKTVGRPTFWSPPHPIERHIANGGLGDPCVL